MTLHSLNVPSELIIQWMIIMRKIRNGIVTTQKMIGTLLSVISLSTIAAQPITQSIPVTRSQCTPFGNPPRPQTKLLTATNSLLCLGGQHYLKKRKIRCMNQHR